jgi:MutS domain V
MPEPVKYDWFTAHEISAYHRALPGDAAQHVDEHTAADLQLDSTERWLAPSLSVFGRQALHHRLRAGRGPNDDLVHLAQASGTAALLAAAGPACEALRGVPVDLASVLFLNAGPEFPAWAEHLWAVPVLGVLALTPLLVQAFSLTLVLLAAYAAFAIWVALRLSVATQRWRGIRQALIVMLRSAQQLGRVATAQAASDPTASLLAPLAAQADALRGLLKRYGLRNYERVQAAVDYSNLILLSDYRRAARLTLQLRSDTNLLRQVFTAVANVDMQLALLHHLRHLPKGLPHCAVQHGAGSALHLVDMVHPLLNAAQPLSLHLPEQGAFVMGHNGVGKSTLLRALGINLVLARALGFCYAQEARVPLRCSGPVVSSIVNEDSLATGESHFMAELRRAQRLLGVQASNAQAVFIIDEIFSGTNFVESTAAAAAVLQHLAGQSMVVVSSHNLVLGQLLQHVLQALCVVRGPGPDERLGVQAGRLMQTNAISLMAQYPFPPEVLAMAHNLSVRLLAQQTDWSHLAPFEPNGTNET